MAFFTIHPREMEQIILNKHALVLDVRERESYREGHFRGAYCCPYEEIDGWMRHFNRNRTLLVYCEYGSTSLLAARQLSNVAMRCIPLLEECRQSDAIMVMINIDRVF